MASFFPDTVLLLTTVVLPGYDGRGGTIQNDNNLTVTQKKLQIHAVTEYATLGQATTQYSYKENCSNEIVEVERHVP